MIKRKAIKYRIYPDFWQTGLANKTFGCCRMIHNLMFEDKTRYYAETGGMLHNTPAQYKDEYPYSERRIRSRLRMNS